jgi:hypothetical protein
MGGGHGTAALDAPGHKSPSNVIYVTATRLGGAVTLRRSLEPSVADQTGIG